MPDTQNQDHTSAERFACFAARLMADSNCQDVIVQDLRGLSQLTDYFVIATTSSDRMMQSIAQDLKFLAREVQRPIHRTAGQDDAKWLVVDLFDVVVHLFEESHRAFYDLEALWDGAKPVDWRNATTPGQFARISQQRAAKGVAGA